ncbi:hypothetical protein AB0M28_28640, partial [Streptomyces sp. NPDC051940]|uniref:hypothetical protein n=1 Tax=Streptomyces sp. NPDC051940 TaxID=3155675 RepID=UPI00341C1C9F
TTDSMIGGELRPDAYQPLAEYFAKFGGARPQTPDGLESPRSAYKAEARSADAAVTRQHGESPTPSLSGV